MLDRRGVEILEAPSTRAGLELFRTHKPSVIVLDWEAESARGSSSQSDWDQEMASQPAEMVILGNLRQDEQPGRRHVVRTPYHYGPLIQMIEQLVQHQSAPSSQNAADAQ